MESKMKIGIIGCGDIFKAYVMGCRRFDILEITTCADLYMEKALQRGEEFDIPLACGVDELLANPEIDLIVNLTIPTAHAEVSLSILEAGKHLYSEKPLAISRADGRKILSLAEEQGLLVGCAPDTFMGGGLQTCRHIIDQGLIGEVVGATAFMTSRGPEGWHPNPHFFYKEGAGPVFDMAPYYLTALINLIGPVDRVGSAARISFPERTATSPQRFGEKIEVEVPTLVAGLLDFSSGPVASIIMSFDIWYSRLPRLEIYGSEGSLSAPDPNNFGGSVLLRQAGDSDWREIPLTHSDQVSRGIGVADMAHAILGQRPHRANGQVAYHVLDIMRALEQSSLRGEHIHLVSQCPKPEPLPTGLPDGKLDW